MGGLGRYLCVLYVTGHACVLYGVYCTCAMRTNYIIRIRINEYNNVMHCVKDMECIIRSVHACEKFLM